MNLFDNFSKLDLLYHIPALIFREILVLLDYFSKKWDRWKELDYVIFF